MDEVMRLLKDKTLSTALKDTTTAYDAARLIVNAGKEKGVVLKVADVTAFLKVAPRKAPAKKAAAPVPMGMARTTYETKLTSCSKLCCVTCRTSVVLN